MNSEKQNLSMKSEDLEQSKTEKSEKEIAWDKKRKEINEIIDSLGLPIDEGVKESVTAFQIHEFPTSASCEGHLHEKGKRRTRESVSLDRNLLT